MRARRDLEEAHQDVPPRFIGERPPRREGLTSGCTFV